MRHHLLVRGLCASFIIAATLGSGYAAEPTAPVVPLSCNAVYSVIKEDGTLLSWGDQYNGQVSEGHQTYQDPEKIADNMRCVENGQYISFAIDTDDKLWAWPAESVSWLYGIEPPSEDAALVQIADQVLMASAGYRHCVILKEDGSVWTLGSNMEGQLGIGIPEDGSSYQIHPAMKVLDHAQFVTANGNTSYAITDNHALWAWGSDIPGRAEPELTPIKLMDDIIYAAPSYSGLLVIKDDHTLWGLGQYTIEGQEGTAEDSPVFLLEDTALCSHGIAIQRDGSLWTWGSNQYGQLGDGMTTDRAKPQKVMDDIVYAETGLHCTLMITRSGELWQAGVVPSAETDGGQNENNAFSVPYKIMDQVQTPFLDLAADSPSPSAPTESQNIPDTEPADDVQDEDVPIASPIIAAAVVIGIIACSGVVIYVKQRKH